MGVRAMYPMMLAAMIRMRMKATDLVFELCA